MTNDRVTNSELVMMWSQKGYWFKLMLSVLANKQQTGNPLM